MHFFAAFVKRLQFSPHNPVLLLECVPNTKYFVIHVGDNIIFYSKSISHNQFGEEMFPIKIYKL